MYLGFLHYSIHRIFILLIFVFSTLQAMQPQILESSEPGDVNIEDVAWSPNQMYLAAIILNNKCNVWYANSAKLFRTFIVHNEITCIAWSANNLLAIGNSAGLIYIYDVSTGKLLRHISVTERVLHMAWSPCGRYLAYIAKNFKSNNVDDIFENQTTIHFIDLQTFEIIQNQIDINYHITNLEWTKSNSGTLLTISQRSISNEKINHITIFESSDCETADYEKRLFKLVAIHNFSSEVQAFKWAPAQDRLAISLVNGTIVILKNGIQLEKEWVSVDLSLINSEISWSADGRYLISGAFDKIMLWDSESDYTEKQNATLDFNSNQGDKSLKEAMINSNHYENLEQIKIVPSKLRWAPNKNLIAASIKLDVPLIFYGHALVVFHMHNTDINYLRMRELNGNRNKRKFEQYKQADLH